MGQTKGLDLRELMSELQLSVTEAGNRIQGFDAAVAKVLKRLEAA